MQDALCAIAQRLNAKRDPKDRTELTVPANLFRFTDQQLKLRQKFTDKKLKERLIAGRMAAAFLKSFEDGRIPAALKGVKRLSLNQVAEFVSETEG